MSDCELWNRPAIGVTLLGALRERMRQPGGAEALGPTLVWLVKDFGTECDKGLRIEAIHDGGNIIVIDTFWSPALYGLEQRRQVELDTTARAYLERLEAQRRAAGWNGNLPAVMPSRPEHTHDFTARTITSFLPLKKGRRRHLTTTHGCCACGLSEPMFDHLIGADAPIRKDKVRVSIIPASAITERWRKGE